MIIFLAFLQGKPYHPIPAYSFWEFYIKKGIEEAGHTWVECSDIDWAEGLAPNNKIELNTWKTNTWEKTIKFLSKNPVDLFLSYLYPNQVDESAISFIKKMGIPCVNFFCDNVREFTVIPKIFNVFDLNWVPEYKAIAHYKKAKLPYINLPMPMWVHPKYRSINFKEKQHISFIGSKDLQRHLFFEDLINKTPNLPIHIYGAGWSKDNLDDTKFDHSLKEKIKFQLSFLNRFGLIAYHRKLEQRKLKIRMSNELASKLKGKPNFNEYIELTKQSMVTIGINRYPSYLFPLSTPNTYSRLRDVEAPMLGACYLTEWTEGLNEFYDIGKEILVYHNTTDFLDQYEMLKNNSNLRKTLRSSGQKRALNDLNISNSISKIKEFLGK